MSINVILYIALGFLFGAIIVGLWAFRLMRRNVELEAELKMQGSIHDQMEGRSKLSAQEAVQAAHKSFLQMAEQNLKSAHKDSSHDLEKRQKAIADMIDPVHKNLNALSGALEQIKGTDKALREDLQSLGRETSKLAGALRNPAARGNWGEAMLERLLENSGLIKDVHYELQKTLYNDEGKTLRPDAVINMPESLHIVIDSKAPINDYVNNLDEDLNEIESKKLQVVLASAVRSHIHDLSKKAYWEQLNSPDFVVLFLPSEHLFSAAVQADTSLLDLAAEKKIVLASPVLMMSLLKVVGMSWRQVDMAKNAQEISDRGVELYNRLLKFTVSIERIGRNLQSAMKGYDEAVGSLQNRVLPAARKFKELQGQTGSKELPDIETIEETPRVLTLTAEDKDEKTKLFITRDYTA